MVESIKHDAADFGGFQTAILSDSERAARMCCAAGCSMPGFSQMISLSNVRLDGGNYGSFYRLLCKKHLVFYALMIAAVLGDPSPTSEAAGVADMIGLDWEMMSELDGVPTVFNPEKARCVHCGGGMVGETVGMYSGKRFVHTCGQPKRRDQA